MAEYEEIHAVAEASASGVYSDEVTANLFDGGSDTQQNCGDKPPGWIQLTWPRAMYVSKIRLQISQQPAGDTTHILVADGKEIHTWKGKTESEQWLEHDVNTTATELRIKTTESPSWVAWKQLNVTGSEAEMRVLELAATRGEAGQIVVTATSIAGDVVATISVSEDGILADLHQTLASQLDLSIAQVQLIAIDGGIVLDNKREDKVVDLLGLK